MNHYTTMISTQVRDDNSYLDEWVKYHLSIGFDHIVVYDHLSVEPVENLWGDTVTVQRENRPGPFLELVLHNQTLRNFRTDWLALLDVDEFIVLFGVRNIKELLTEYKDTGGLVANWLVYGSSGHEQRPAGLVKDNYLWCTPPEYHLNDVVKPIIQTRFCRDIYNQHACHSNTPLVNEDFEECPGWVSHSAMRCIRVNHYITRSHEEWLAKTARGHAVKDGALRNESRFQEINRNATVYDPVLKDWCFV